MFNAPPRLLLHVYCRRALYYHVYCHAKPLYVYEVNNPLLCVSHFGLLLGGVMGTREDLSLYIYIYLRKLLESGTEFPLGCEFMFP